MLPNRGERAIRRLLVAIPNWVGDVVLAAPVLAALRTHFADARITYLLRPYVTDVVDGGGWHDAVVTWPGGRGLGREFRTLRLAARLRAERFDLALLLTNSFRSAFVVWRAGVPRRVGYAREARGGMLTDRLRPARADGEYTPSPVLDYYADLAAHVGCRVDDRRLRLGVTPGQEAAGRSLLRHYSLDDGRPYAVVNPGAAYGDAKCWPPERFAQACDRLRDELGLRPVLVGSPGEGTLLRGIAERAAGPVVCCNEPGTTLGSLKVVVRESALVLCNDTGPRHYANAFNVPTVTLFGPTHPAWTDTGYTGEIKLQVPVECGPCQLRNCPLDWRCMTGLTVERVMEAVREILQRHSKGAVPGGSAGASPSRSAVVGAAAPTTRPQESSVECS